MNEIIGGILLSMFLSIILCSCGEEKRLASSMQSPEVSSIGQPDQIMGLWRGNRVKDTIKFTFDLEIGQDRIAQHVICQFSDGSTLSTSISVAATLGDKAIRVLEDKIDTKTDKGKICGVSLSPREIPYHLENGLLIVTNLNDDQTDKLRRIK